MSSRFAKQSLAGPPSYRARLRLEGTALAGMSAVAALLVIVVTRLELDVLFAVQAAVGVMLLAVLGPRSARTAMRRSERVAGKPGSGEPTPLWHLLVILAAFVPLLGLLIDGLSALSFATGAGLVGLTQAVLIERAVAAEERRTGRRFFRRPGSRILRGTRLGWTEPTAS